MLPAFADDGNAANPYEVLRRRPGSQPEDGLRGDTATEPSGEEEER